MKLKNILRISFGLFLAFVMVIPAIAQNSKTFKGVVLDETEQPIIGAAVKVVGTTIGTITDFDGNFTLNVPDGKEVEISYIGYVTQHFSAPFKLTKCSAVGRGSCGGLWYTEKSAFNWCHCYCTR